MLDSRHSYALILFIDFEIDMNGKRFAWQVHAFLCSVDIVMVLSC